MEAEELIHLLRERASEVSSEALFDWFKDHGHDKSAGKVFEEALMCRDSEEMAYIASQLIYDHSQYQFISFVESWAEHHPKSQILSVLLRSLVLTNPNNKNINRAYEWVCNNRSHWYSNAILAALLEVCPNPTFTKEAINKIQSAKQDDYELILVIDPLVHSSIESAKVVANWIDHNIAHPLVSDMLLEAFKAAPEVFLDSVITWLSLNKKETNVSLILEAKAWLSLNKNHPKASKLLPYLR